jgi:hypothetical protein
MNQGLGETPGPLFLSVRKKYEKPTAGFSIVFFGSLASPIG